MSEAGSRTGDANVLTQKIGISRHDITEKSVNKNSSRPAFDTSKIQTHGTMSVRRIPERAQCAPQGGALAQPPAHAIGLKRFDDQRPNSYITEHMQVQTDLNLKRCNIQITQLQEPHTDWAERLPERPYAGIEKIEKMHIPKHNVRELGIDPRLDEVKNESPVAEFHTLLQTRERGEDPVWGHKLTGRREMQKDQRPPPNQGKNENDKRGDYWYNQHSGWESPRVRNENRTIWQNLAWLQQPEKEYHLQLNHQVQGDPRLHARILRPYSTTKFMQLKQDQTHDEFLLDRRELWMQGARSKYVGRNWQFRQTGMLSDLEYLAMGEKSLSPTISARHKQLGPNADDCDWKVPRYRRCESVSPKHMRQSLWPHRLPWLKEQVDPTRKCAETTRLFNEHEVVKNGSTVRYGGPPRMCAMSK